MQEIKPQSLINYLIDMTNIIIMMYLYNNSYYILNFIYSVFTIIYTEIKYSKEERNLILYYKNLILFYSLIAIIFAPFPFEYPEINIFAIINNPYYHEYIPYIQIFLINTIFILMLLIRLNDVFKKNIKNYNEKNNTRVYNLRPRKI